MIGTGAHPRRSRVESYRVPEDGGGVGVVVDGAPDVVVSLGVLGVAVGGGGEVGGDAAGTRSPGRSLTRSVPLSVHAVARVATSARAVKPSSALFMNAPPR